MIVKKDIFEEKEFKEKKMKVLQIIPTLNMAGAEIMCENLTYELIKKGHDVVVVSLYTLHSPITERLENKGVKIYYLNKKKGLDLSVIQRIKKVIKVEKPDVVHTHLDSLKYVGLATIFKKIKIVHTVHNIAEKESGGIARKINCSLFKKRVVPVALSEIVQQSIKRIYQLPLKRVPVIYNGIDLSKCIKKTEYCAKNPLKILHIGRFSTQKNHIGLLKAFKLFHKTYPNSKLQLIGEGERKAEAEQFVADNKLSEAVEFLGLKDNVYGYLHDADIFTLPSLYEGIPMTLIEAMGTGLPIVATKVGGIPDMLKDQESALLVDVDEEQIAGAFMELAQNEEKRARLGLAAKQGSIKFSAELMAEKYLQIYCKG